MNPKTAILLRLALRTAVFLLAIGVLVREAACVRTTVPADKPPETGTQPTAPKVYTAFAFDTKCSLVLWGDEKAADAAATAAIQLLGQLHATLNRYDPASELARFNAAPANIPFACSDLLWNAFDAARTAWRQTDGVFDVTIGPLMAFWKHAAATPDKPPDTAAREEAQRRVGFEKLLLDDMAHTVTKTADGMSVDFGGLAKGLAIDLVRPEIARAGIFRMMLDFGGNLFLEDPNDRPDSGEVRIRDPRAGDHTSGKMLGTLTDANHRCVATSANSERPLATGARPIGHIMDPRTGQPADALEQVTVVTPRGVDSDVFSTAVFIDGPDLARKLAEQCPATGFVLLPTAEPPYAIGDAVLKPYSE